jgi:hypothetical protein
VQDLAEEHRVNDMRSARASRPRGQRQAPHAAGPSLRA